MVKLSNTTLRLMSVNNTLKGKLADVMGKGLPTIERWIDKNDPMLTTVTALELIKKELGLTDAEIFEPETAAA